MAIDVNAMWDYDRPAVSEQRFRDALASAQGDEALVLRTQIARTFSLRGQFDAANAELDAIASALPSAGAEPRVRALLERGRTLRSSRHAAEARPLFVEAFERADAARLEFLAGDALHMVALVETTPAGQLEWNRRAVAYARKAHDPQTRRWQASALNNMGVTLNSAGRHEEALATFKEALAAYARSGKPGDIRFARWQIAHTLRLLKRNDEALAMQLDLASQYGTEGAGDPDVFEELALLYEARDDAAKAAHCRDLMAKAKAQ